MLKSFCFWGCVCLGRREYVELCCGVQILLFLGLCVFRSERIRRVVLRVQILLFLGLCVFRSERIRRVVLRVQILLFLGLCVFRSERIRRVVLRCSNPSVSGVVCV